MKVVLIGFMGSGKSSVAILLANALNYKIIECDLEIVKLSGLQSVADIFKNRGESYFRDLESRVSEDLRNLDNIVISPGGGMIFNPKNLKNLKNGDSVVIYLEASYETLVKRISETPGGISSRPLMQDDLEAKRLYNSRLIGYKECADLIVNTELKTVQNVADEILEVLRQR